MASPRAVPSGFVCPISEEVMVDPVVDPEGNSYERQAIEAWLKRSGTSPVTRSPLHATQLVPNRALKESIDEFRRQMPASPASPRIISPTSTPEVYSHKLVLVGDSGVGKTSIVQRFMTDDFEADQNPTIGGVFQTKLMPVSGATIHLEIWDTAGQERFRSVVSMYFRDMSAAFIIFDITQTRTFKSVSEWVSRVKASEREALIFIVGNKSDLSAKRAVSVEEATELADKYELPYFETSAATGDGIVDTFATLGRLLPRTKKKTTNTVQLVIEQRDAAAGSRKSGCCW